MNNENACGRADQLVTRPRCQPGRFAVMEVVVVVGAQYLRHITLGLDRMLDAEPLLCLNATFGSSNVQLDQRVRNVLFARDFRGTPAVEAAVAPLVVVVGIGGGGHSVVITPVVRVIAG